VIELGAKEWNQCLALTLREVGKWHILKASSVNLVSLMEQQIA
jgi:hypothetical protein